MKKIILILMLVLMVSNALAFNTLNLDKASFDSTGKTWSLLIAETGLEESAKGTFTKSQLESKSGVLPTSNLEITSQVSDNRCLYDLTSTARNVYAMVDLWPSGKYFFYKSSAESECFNAGGFLVTSTSSMFNRHCFKKTFMANALNIEDKQYVFKETLNVKVDNKAAETVILSTNPSLGTPLLGQSSDGLVKARWTGNLETGINCPQPEQQKISGIRENNVYGFISDIPLNTYLSYEATGFKACVDTVSSQGEDSVINYARCVSTYNSQSTNARQRVAWTPQRILSPVQIVGNQVVVKTLPLQFPVFSLEVKADYLEIFQPKGIPVIQSVTGTTFMESKVGVIKATVLNDATNRASFEVGISCPQPANVVTPRRFEPFEAKETKTMDFQISGATGDADSKLDCEFCATDSITFQKVCKTAMVTIENARNCDEGASYCNGNVVVKCENNQLVQKQCSGTCATENGVAQCSENQVGCETDAFCQNKYGVADSCSEWYCNKEIFGKDTCMERELPEDRQPDKCKEKVCNPVTLGALVVFPDISQKCFDSKEGVLGKFSLAYLGYIIQIIIYLLSLFLLWLPISKLLKEMGLTSGTKKYGGLDYLRVALSLIVGWLISVLIWTLLIPFILVALLVVISSIIIKKVIPGR